MISLRSNSSHIPPRYPNCNKGKNNNDELSVTFFHVIQMNGVGEEEKRDERRNPESFRTWNTEKREKCGVREYFTALKATGGG